MAFTEKIGTLTKTSSTQVQLAGTSIVKLGGQQRVLNSPTLLTSVSGLGGLDVNPALVNLLSNSTFDTDISGWVANLGSISFSSGTLLINSLATIGSFHQVVNLVVGKTYYVNCTFTKSEALRPVAIRVWDSVGTIVSSGTTSTAASGSLTHSFVATESTMRVGAYHDRNATATSNFDNFSIVSDIASSFYYVYAVYNGSATGLIASLSAVSPTGFTRFKKVGAFNTNTSSQVSLSFFFGENKQIKARAIGAVTSIPSGSSAIPVNPTVEYDTASSYNNSNGIFTMPCNGYCTIEAAFKGVTTLGTTQAISIIFYRDSIESGIQRLIGNGASNSWSLSGTATFFATAGQTIYYRISSGNGFTLVGGGGGDNFMGVSVEVPIDWKDY